MSKKHVTENKEQNTTNQESVPPSEGGDNQPVGSAMLEVLGAPAELVEAAQVAESEAQASTELVKIELPAPVEQVKLPFGIGQLARHLILKTDKSNAEILAVIHKVFPAGNTTPACIAWYKTDLRKKGLLAASEKRGSAKTVALTEEQLQALLK